MRIVILAGGRGTRLRPLTYSLPKPLLPIGETPILELMIRRFSTLGLNDITLMTGYRSELIEAYFGNGRRFNVRIRYVKEKKRLGTAGPLRLLKGLEGPFLVMNGDILTGLDPKRMLNFHIKKGASITVGTRRYEETLPYGVVESEGDLVKGMKERPILRFEVSGGIYILEPSIIRLIEEDLYLDMPELILRAIDNGMKVLRYPIKEYWISIEKIDDLDGALKKVKDADLGH
jgi:NDP-sugar pyrophosphorylase family protein